VTCEQHPATALGQALLAWSDGFNVGIASIDDQHRELVALLNRFAGEVESNSGTQRTTFEAFRNALSSHFLFEDELLQRMAIDPALLDNHRKHHADSLELVAQLAHHMADDTGDNAARALAEIAHCLLVDLLNQDLQCFNAMPAGDRPATTLPLTSVLNTFGRLFGVLGEHQHRVAQARDYYLTLLDDFPTPICRSDVGGRFDWFNRTWLSLTGLTLEAAMAGKWTDAIHPEDGPKFLSAWEQNTRTRVPFADEFRLANATGGWSWIHQICHPFFDAQGSFVGYICTLFDVTERRRTESSLSISAAVFEHAAEGIMITDSRGRIEAINPAFQRITGYSPAEAVGASANLLRSGLHEASFYQSLWRSVMAHGRWRGEIVNRRKNGEVFPAWLSITVIRDGDGRVARMVGVFSDIASSREQHLMHLAHHDALTGIPNRLLFSARAQHSLERCMREGCGLAVLFIDLDDFKPVNDGFGHKIGDAALRGIAARLQGLLRDEDTIARFGGDEFVVLVERVDGRAAALAVAEKLRSAFPFQFDAGGTRIGVCASIGFSVYPEDGNSIDELVDLADRAMYEAKRAVKPGGRRMPSGV
jgi:diguanylate cyclase (GGDEF)-like protein/PAS domain S-box-containing protein/hemerythrin-like metal-binding protein